LHSVPQVKMWGTYTPGSNYFTEANSCNFVNATINLLSFITGIIYLPEKQTSTMWGLSSNMVRY